MVLLGESVLVPVLLAGPPLVVCGWLLFRVLGRPLVRKIRSCAPSKRFRWAVVGSAVAMYVAALFLPTAAPFNPTYSNTAYPGYDAFRMWKVLVEWEPSALDWWVLSLAWLANPAIWVAIILTAAGRQRTAGVAAACGVTLGLVPLPRYYMIVAGLPGYWAWVGSPGLVLAASLAPGRRLATGASVESGLAADYDDPVAPPNPQRAPDRGGGK